MICSRCGESYLIGDWPFCPHTPATRHLTSIHPGERAIKFYHPELGWRTPGRNDAPMPERYSKLGFERVEFGSFQALNQHGKQTGARSEVLDYDNSGHAEREYTEK